MKIIKHIDEKTRTIICANEVDETQPLVFQPNILVNKDGSKMSISAFRTRVIRELIDGEYEAPIYSKYKIIANAIRNTNQYRELERILWNKGIKNDEYRTKSKEFNTFISKMIPLCDKHFEKRKNEIKNANETQTITIKNISNEMLNGKCVSKNYDSVVENHFQFEKDFYKQTWNERDNSGRSSIRTTTILSHLISQDAIIEYNKLYSKSKKKDELIR